MLISSNNIHSYALFEPRESSYDKEHSTLAQANSKSDSKDEEGTSTQKNSTNELNSSEEQQIAELKQRDTEVRAHEAAHIAAGGSAVAGAASFTYQKGPDGQLYAVGGEVALSSSGSANTPEEKIALAKQLRAGALAPANPSPQDLKVASSAAQMEALARQELVEQERNEDREKENLNSYEKEQESTMHKIPHIDIRA